MEPRFYCFGINRNLPWPNSAQEYMANGCPIDSFGQEFDRTVCDPKGHWLHRFAFRSRQSAINAGNGGPGNYFGVVMVFGSDPSEMSIIYEKSW